MPRQRYLGGRQAVGTRTRYTGGRHSAGPRTRYTGQDTTPAPPPETKHGHGGLLGTIEHIITQTPKDLGNAALQAPGGIYKIAKVGGNDAIAIAEGAPRSDPRRKAADELGHAILHSTVETLKHPARHPGDTLLLGLPALGAVGKASEAGAIAKAGGTASEVARAAIKGAPGTRTLKVGGLEVRGHYSKAAGSRVVQKLTDAGLQKGAEKSVRVENVLHKRAAKWNDRNQRVADSVARTPGTRLAALGQKLKPEEQRALRLVAEETPVARRLGAQEMRKARATHPKEQTRHQERIDLTRSAMKYLDEGTDGKPVFKPEAAKLRNIYDHLKSAAGDREAMLKSLDLMDEAQQQAAKTKVAQVAAGATYEKPTPGKLGVASDALTAARARVVRVGKLVDKAELRQPLDNLMPTYLGGKGDTRIVAGLRSAHSLAKEDLQRLESAAAKRVKPTGMVGAEDITASPDAVFVGNPVERGRFTGKVKVSSTRTIGHTTKPSSLKTSTGASVAHALERNDVTNIVAERHSEAVRLTKIDRLVQSVKKAGEAAPRRKDDVFVWTDKLTSNERIPKEVRQYLDNPEGLAKLPPHEQVSVTDKIKNAIFDTQDWRDPEKVAEFQKLAETGKGVFVPRRLLGDAAKRDFQLGQVPGVHFADAVNNAQKAGLVYLKLNYPIVQGLSNTAMNLIHQGPFAIKNLTRAVKLDHQIGSDYAAIIDDIMGQGAVVQAQLEGQGAIANVSQKIAHVMSSKVDTPSRRAAFLHEAAQMGYKTGDQLKSLIDHDKNAGDLAEIAQRSKESIVDYGDLSPFERSVVKRLVFVYPWQKGATKYAGHFLRDHPVQAAALSQAAVQGKSESDRVFGAIPSYMNGLIPVGDKRSVNPAGVNFFQTPAQIGEAIAGTLTLDPAAAASGQDFLAPAPGLLVAALTQHDNLGRPLKGNALTAARDLTIGQTPGSALIRAATSGHSGIALGGRGPTKTFPDANDPFWRFLLGGLYPRKTSTPTLNQNAAYQKLGR